MKANKCRQHQAHTNSLSLRSHQTNTKHTQTMNMNLISSKSRAKLNSLDSGNCKHKQPTTSNKMVPTSIGRHRSNTTTKRNNNNNNIQLAPLCSLDNQLTASSAGRCAISTSLSLFPVVFETTAQIKTNQISCGRPNVAALWLSQEENDKQQEQQQQARGRKFASSLLCCYSSALLLLLVVIVQLASQVAQAAKLPDIYWNASNPIFRIDNTDHIFDVNKKQNDHDQVDLVCPQNTGLVANTTTNSAESQATSATQLERYMIYSVSKDEYDTCRLNGQPGARVVAVCDQQAGKANRPPITITFRSFTPQPNGLEFKPGQDYYFITANMPTQTGGSNGAASSTLDAHRRFAPCREQNMKVTFKVCCKSQTNAPTNSQQTNSILPQSQIGASNNANNLHLRQAAPVANTRRPNQQQQQQLIGNNVASNVITLRPSYKQPGLSLGDYLSTIAPSQQQQQQAAANIQPQPITVLPIEVLQPTNAPGEQQQQQQQSPTDSDTGDNERNDIVQNEQPARVIAGQQQQQQQQQQNAYSRQQQTNSNGPTSSSGLLFAFDPRAAPETLRNYGPYAPTPLPPRLIMVPQQQQQQQLAIGRQQTNLPAQMEPAPWQAQLASSIGSANSANSRSGGGGAKSTPLANVGRNQQTTSLVGGASESVPPPTIGNYQHQRATGQSRLSLYPWPTATHDPMAPTRDLITVHDKQLQQQSDGQTAALGFGPTSALYLLAPLLALAILLAWGLERTLR